MSWLNKVPQFNQLFLVSGCWKFVRDVEYALVPNLFVVRPSTELAAIVCPLSVSIFKSL